MSTASAPGCRILESWKESLKRKAVSTPKFYFFDTGAANFLRGTLILPENSVEYGKAFEQFFAMELRAWISYTRARKPRTVSAVFTGPGFSSFSGSRGFCPH
ncbi:MAG: DUF4143 domain-containing protein [Spirochaetales bacterium]|nr:MAG: DUF4143 domain-containing protein [Spirochaetales bacterium]